MTYGTCTPVVISHYMTNLYCHFQERRRRVEAERHASDEIERLRLEVAALKNQKPVSQTMIFIKST